MHNQGQREKLISEYQELLKKKREAETEEERKYLDELAQRRHQEVLLMDEYRELLKKKREAETEEERKHFSELAHQKYQEALMEHFGGDKNIGRFNKW